MQAVSSVCENMKYSGLHIWGLTVQKRTAHKRPGGPCDLGYDTGKSAATRMPDQRDGGEVGCLCSVHEKQVGRGHRRWF